jgi:hypothetical protein
MHFNRLSVLRLVRYLGTVAVLFALQKARAEDGLPSPKRMGEAYTWKMRILGLFDAGRARLAIAPPYRSDGTWQIHAVGEAEATGFIKEVTGLHGDYRLTLDGATLLPRRMELDETGLSSRKLVVKLDGRRFDLLLHRPGVERHFIGLLPSAPVEPVALLLLLRTPRLADGDRLDVIVMDGSNFYQGTIEVQSHEELSSSLGVRRAIRLFCRGEAINERGVKLGRPPRQATLWLSDDAYRLPLRVQAQTDYGTGQFELTSFEPARRPIPAPSQLSGIIEHPHNDGGAH